MVQSMYFKLEALSNETPRTLFLNNVAFIFSTAYAHRLAPFPFEQQTDASPLKSQLHEQTASVPESAIGTAIV